MWNGGGLEDEEELENGFLVDRTTCLRQIRSGEVVQV
jgi:hypothetical protein